MKCRTHRGIERKQREKKRKPYICTEKIAEGITLSDFMGKNVMLTKNKRRKKVDSTECCHVRGRAPLSKTFLIYISCAFCLGLMC